MAVILGKRKRRRELPGADPVKERNSSSNEDDDAARKAFQLAFEAKFKPLERTIAKSPVEQEDETNLPSDDDDDDDSDWSGLSDGADQVEVVEHAGNESAALDTLSKNKNSFMSSKPPRAEPSVSVTKPIKVDNGEDVGDEATNLKHDLALQRLLKESHLLDSSSIDRDSTAPKGKGRLKALDMRVQDLGAKSSVLQQVKMPMSHRKGIAAKSASRETGRRKEASENGIILEKAKFAAKSQKRRERGVGGPGVGKFKGGTLKLSSWDVRSIQGPVSKGSKGKGRRS